jgi:predicted ATPase/DNA-binding SARP family transcriptional activator
MEFRVLGPLEVVEGGEQIDVGARKPRVLLALLLINANRVVTTDRILEEMWGDDAHGKENALWVHVSRLRSVLGGHEVLVTRHHGYSLLVSSDAIDAHRFEVAANEGHALIEDDPVAASARLNEALGIWRGAAYEEFEDEPFAQVEITRLDELRLASIADRIDADLNAGESAGLVSELESLVRVHPLNERFVSQLMSALHRSGRTADALAAYERARRALSEELGIEPSRMLQIREREILVDDGTRPPSLPADRPPHNLPAETTRFVGRDAEVRGVTEAIADSRLVTLTGIGGVGKTRIAVHVARDLVDRFPDGAWIARLAPASSAQVRDVVIQALAPAISSEPGSFDELALTLVAKELLVVLDNCEHVISSCAEVVQQLLESSPGIRVLATSRQPLELGAETVWPVAPMPVPDPTDRELTTDQIADFDSVQLFMERARAARPGFALSEDHQAHVVRICQKVAGIPLALELSAARLRSMTVAEIASALDRAFDLLTRRSPTGVARHQTLQATLDWSFDLLDEQERLVLGRLPAFHLSFPHRAAELICAGGGVDESEILDLLGRLVDTSWIAMESVGEQARYYILQIVREFLYTKDIGADWDRQREGQRRGWVILLAQRTDPALKGSDREMWSVLLDGDEGMARRALDVAYEQRAVEEGTFLAGAAAALKSTTRRLGFIGGVEEPHLERFRRGFVAGANHVDPAAVVECRYLSKAPDYTGFWDRALMREVASDMYQRGVDVVMQAAGQAAGGLPEAAVITSETTGHHKWCIGVDFDWYDDVPETEGRHVLTSVRFQIPTSIYRTLKEAVAAGEPDLPRFDLASGAVVLARSGGHLDDISDQIDVLGGKIIAGSIEVPT